MKNPKTQPQKSKQQNFHTNNININQNPPEAKTYYSPWNQSYILYSLLAHQNRGSQQRLNPQTIQNKKTENKAAIQETLISCIGSQLYAVLSQISTTIMNNAQIIEYLVHQTQMHSNLLNQIKKLMAIYQLSNKNNQQKQRQKMSASNHCQSILQEVTGITLFNFLYGPKNNFVYFLRQDPSCKLNHPLFRQKNFKFGVELVDGKGDKVHHQNNIRLCIALYSVETNPKLITSTPQGGQLMKGFTEIDLTNGSCTFQKLQIKSVTSHFKNGSLFLLVFPKQHCLILPSSHHLDYKKIKPFIFERVTVKAKRTKASLLNQK